MTDRSKTRNQQRMGRPATGELLLGWVPALMVWSRGLSISLVEGRPIRCSFLLLFRPPWEQLRLPAVSPMVLPAQSQAQLKGRLAEVRVWLSWL